MAFFSCDWCKNDLEGWAFARSMAFNFIADYGKKPKSIFDKQYYKTLFDKQYFMTLKQGDNCPKCGQRVKEKTIVMTDRHR